MPVNITDIETAIKEALPVSYLEVNDQSNGCGESYSIVVVSEVRVHGCSKMKMTTFSSNHLQPLGIRGEVDTGETSSRLVRLFCMQLKQLEPSYNYQSTRSSRQKLPRCMRFHRFLSLFPSNVSC